jgi:signal transduction histidine kinase
MMKLFRKVSLRLRLVLLMGAVLTIACTTFLLTSNASARDTYKIQRIVEEKYGIVPKELLTYTKLVEGLLQTQDHVFGSKNMMIAVFIVLLGTGATYFVAKRALKPVAALSREVSRISESNLSTRVAVPDSKDEVTALAEAFNKMIGKLEKAFLSQKNFSANAAHELRTPLTAMIACIEVCQLDEQPSLPEYRETLDEVLQNAERLKTLVNDLLMMNADSDVILNEAIDARALMERIIRELTPIAGTGIRFDNRIGALTLIGNQSLLYRAFFNLLHNAVKYNKPGGSVTVSGAVEDAVNVITVTDTGIGIPTEQLDKIFDSFYCVDKSHSRELGGSGLGLSIVKSIIEKHNGTIGVQSKPGVSTTFTVRLPK